MAPRPFPTAKYDDDPFSAQVPPSSAAPQPVDSVRPKASAANAAPGVDVTVTDRVVLAVAPSLSVTISVMV